MIIHTLCSTGNANEAVELGLFEPSKTTKSDTSDTKPASPPPENLKSYCC
jgi:hypothetical protein